MNEDPIPFRSNGKSNGTHDEDVASDDAIEVMLDEPEADLPVGRTTARLTGRLEDMPGAAAGALSDLLTAPLQLFPAETRQHARNAGREASLALAELGSGLFKGLALAFSVAGEALKGYSEREGKITDLDSVRSRRRKVDIEVE